MKYRISEIIPYVSRKAPILVARKGVETVFGLVTFAVLARELTKHEFAIYGLVLTLVSLFRVSALPGIGVGLSQAFARGSVGGFGHAVRLSLSGSLLGVASLLLISGWHYLSGDIQTARILAITAALFPGVSGLTFWRNAALGEERYTWFFSVELLLSAAKCGVILACVYLVTDPLFFIVFFMLVVTAIVHGGATMIQAVKIPKTASFESGMVEYGLRISLYQIPASIAAQADRLFLFYLVSAPAMASYTVAQRIPELARAVVGDVNTTLGPIFARDGGRTEGLHAFSFKLWGLYIAVSVIGAILVVPFLLPILAGSKYVDMVIYAQLMTVGVSLGYLGNIQFRYVKSKLDSKSFLHITMFVALLDLSLILGFGYLYGLNGMVAAYILKNAGRTMLTNFIVRRKYTSPREA